MTLATTQTRTTRGREKRIPGREWEEKLVLMIGDFSDTRIHAGGYRERRKHCADTKAILVCGSTAREVGIFGTEMKTKKGRFGCSGGHATPRFGRGGEQKRLNEAVSPRTQTTQPIVSFPDVTGAFSAMCWRLVRSHKANVSRERYFYF